MPVGFLGQAGEHHACLLLDKAWFIDVLDHSDGQEKND